MRASLGFRHISRRCVGVLAVLLMLPLLNGCAAVGAIIAKTTIIKVKPSYSGLKGQSVGILVFASRQIRIDHPLLQLDLAWKLDTKLKTAAGTKDPPPELAGTTFPASKNPEAMYAFQQNNPQIAESILEFAPKLGVTRLIYIEVDDFALHPDEIAELFRGKLIARIDVIEIANGKATSVYGESLETIFPEKSQPEGEPGLGDAPTYRGVLEVFGQNALKRFVTHEEEE